MEFAVLTRGHTDVVDITEQIAALVATSGVRDGVVFVFVPGSTAALTTLEYEPGIIADLRELLERLIPEAQNYRHHQRWGDRNGAAHLRSALIGPDLVVPLHHGQLALGTWQQIVLLDFDERPRRRTIHVTVIPGAA